MRTKLTLHLLAPLLGVALTTTLHAQSSSPSAFTYQGYLTENGAPANGTNGFQFSLYAAATSGTQPGLEIGSFNDGTRQFDGLTDDVRFRSYP